MFSNRFDDIVKLLGAYKVYAEKSGKITGPNAAWYANLVGPAVAFYAILLVSTLFTSRGYLVFLPACGIGYWSYKQEHRLNHVSKYVNIQNSNWICNIRLITQNILLLV